MQWPEVMNDREADYKGTSKTLLTITCFTVFVTHFWIPKLDPMQPCKTMLRSLFLFDPYAHIFNIEVNSGAIKVLARKNENVTRQCRIQGLMQNVTPNM